MRKGFWIAFWSVLCVVVWRGALLSASIRNLRLSGQSGAGPTYAELNWGYGPGARPQSIIFDLELAGTTSSVTTDGEETEAQVPLGAAATGSYRVSASATYRILGLVRYQVFHFEGTTG